MSPSWETGSEDSGDIEDPSRMKGILEVTAAGVVAIASWEAGIGMRDRASCTWWSRPMLNARESNCADPRQNTASILKTTKKEAAGAKRRHKMYFYKELQVSDPCLQISSIYIIVYIRRR